MAEPWDTYRWQLDSAITSMYQQFGYLKDETFDLYQELTDEGNPKSGLEAYAMSVKVNAIRTRWGLGSSTFPGRLNICLDYLYSEISGGDITMDSILTAMMTATAEQITEFMGITQAYKVAVWDAPFNEEFYAALARGFKVWGA